MWLTFSQVNSMLRGACAYVCQFEMRIERSPVCITLPIKFDNGAIELLAGVRAISGVECVLRQESIGKLMLLQHISC